jgi:uncharacterized delta-60 repeat protein
MSGACGGVACAAWLTPQGQKASGFGTAGTGTALFSDFSGWPNDGYGGLDAAALPDGRVVVLVSKSGSGAYLAMLRADGTGLDPAIGNGSGYVVPGGYPFRVLVTPQQQIILLSNTTVQPYSAIVTRYDSTLHVDTLFGTGGSTTIGFADGSFTAYGMTLQRDGKIVMIGEVSTAPRNVGIIRLTAGGAPDPAFGVNSDGRYESNLGNVYGAHGNAIVEDKKGRLVFVGFVSTEASGHGEWLVNRILGGGAVDSTFNAGHPQQFTITTDSPSTENTPRACCVALQSDNRIVVAGSVDRPDTFYTYFGLARFNPDGLFDYSFGGSGQAYGDMSTQAPNVQTDTVNSLVLVGGGILVGSSTTTNVGNETRFVAVKARIDLLLAADFE